MKIIKPYIVVESEIKGEQILKDIEKIGRVCYKSEDRITKDSSIKFMKSLINRGHLSVIEHKSISVRVICDRGVTHEIVRHRIASYSQESSRYCCYSDDKFGNELTFIKPLFLNEQDVAYETWLDSMHNASFGYFKMLEQGKTPQEARSVLPNSLKTEIVMTMNLREWIHFFKLRTAPSAHPQMIEVADMILAEFKKEIPIIFDNI